MDLIQEANLALLDAIKSYNKARCIYFKNYAEIIIKKRLFELNKFSTELSFEKILSKSIKIKKLVAQSIFADVNDLRIDSCSRQFPGDLGKGRKCASLRVSASVEH